MTLGENILKLRKMSNPSQEEKSPKVTEDRANDQRRGIAVL